jgi:hypothetical protein
MDVDAAISGLVPYGFHERYSAWTGRAWLEIVVEDGDATRVARTIPIDADYGPLRSALRKHYPHAPFDAAWSPGRFPASPLGLPVDATVLLLAIVVAALVGGLASRHPAGWLALGLLYPIVRLRDGVQVTSEGVRAGPAWAPVVPWHEIASVRIVRSWRSHRVFVVGQRGASSGTVPAVLLPALRARLRRQGGLRLEEPGHPVDLVYAVWQTVSPGIAWGALAGTLVIAPFTADPWRVVLAGGLAAAALGLLAATVEARATGWGTGAIAFASAVYGVVLAALAVAAM